MLVCDTCGATGLFERREYVRHVMVVDKHDEPIDDEGAVDMDETLGDREYQCLVCANYGASWVRREGVR